MVTLKTKTELTRMHEACQIAAYALQAGKQAVKAGVTTADIDRIVHKTIKLSGAYPSFLGYNGFKKSCCISVNNEVIHGIPSNKVIHDGDIVSIDVGAFYKGYHGDNALTVAVGEISDDARKLMDVTEQSLYKAIEAAVAGARIGDIGYAVQSMVEKNGFAVVREYVGHGIGSELHESPEIPNFGTPGKGTRLLPGMTIAIEPMVNMNGHDVIVAPDNWTIRTASGTPSAHFEHTIAITDNGPVILTAIGGSL